MGEIQQSISHCNFLTVASRGCHGVSNIDNRLFIQQFIHVNNKENMKPHMSGPLRCEFTSHRWTPLTKGQWCGKRFHVWRHHVLCDFLEWLTKFPLNIKYYGCLLMISPRRHRSRSNFDDKCPTRRYLNQRRWISSTLVCVTGATINSRSYLSFTRRPWYSTLNYDWYGPFH